MLSLIKHGILTNQSACGVLPILEIEIMTLFILNFKNKCMILKTRRTQKKI